MARKKGAKAPGKLLWSSYAENLLLYILAIIVLLLLTFSLSSCARGGGKPVFDNLEAGVDSSTLIQIQSVVDASEATTPEPSYCGDGKIDIDRNEECDGLELGGASCMSLLGYEGTLGCTELCRYDDSMCYAGTPIAGSGAEETAVAGYGGP